MRTWYDREGLPIPDREFAWAIAPPRAGGPGGLPPEMNRRRRDMKVPGWYMAGLMAVNKTYGRLSEYGDLAVAVKTANTPLQLLGNLALSEAVDRAYGYRAKKLREKLYSKPYYRLPVGVDMLSRLWH